MRTSLSVGGTQVAWSLEIEGKKFPPLLPFLYFFFSMVLKVSIFYSVCSQWGKFLIFLPCAGKVRYENNKFENFSLEISVHSNRVTQLDLLLHNSIQKHGESFFFQKNMFYLCFRFSSGQFILKNAFSYFFRIFRVLNVFM